MFDKNERCINSLSFRKETDNQLEGYNVLYTGVER